MSPYVTPPILSEGTLECQFSTATETHYRGQHVIVCFSANGTARDDVIRVYLRPNGTIASSLIGYYDYNTNCFEMWNEQTHLPEEICG